MQVLITRPEPQARRMAAALRRRGHRCIIDPVLIRHRLPPPELAAEEVDGLILTSANAAFAIQPELRDRPVFAVGAATAERAREAGALHVIEAGGDWRSLVRRIVDMPELVPGRRLVHFAGSEVQGAIDRGLEEAGFAYRRVEVYAMHESESLSKRTQLALTAGRIDAVLFLSPRTSRVWRRLAERAGLVETLATVTAVCLSPSVAEPIEDMG